MTTSSMLPSLRIATLTTGSVRTTSADNWDTLGTALRSIFWRTLSMYMRSGTS